jgi:hypothetical protein
MLAICRRLDADLTSADASTIVAEIDVSRQRVVPATPSPPSTPRAPP